MNKILLNTTYCRKFVEKNEQDFVDCNILWKNLLKENKQDIAENL